MQHRQVACNTRQAFDSSFDLATRPFFIRFSGLRYSLFDSTARFSAKSAVFDGEWNGRRSSHVREGGSVMVSPQLWISSANQASPIRLSALGDTYFRGLPTTILSSFFIAIISFTLEIKYILSYILVYNILE